MDITTTELGIYKEKFEKRKLEMRSLTKEGVIIGVRIEGLSKMARRTRDSERAVMRDSARRGVQTAGVTYTLPAEARKLGTIAERLRTNLNNFSLDISGLNRGERWLSTRKDDDGFSMLDLWYEKHLELITRWQAAKNELVGKLPEYRKEMEQKYEAIATENLDMALSQVGQEGVTVPDEINLIYDLGRAITLINSKIGVMLRKDMSVEGVGVLIRKNTAVTAGHASNNLARLFDRRRVYIYDQVKYALSRIPTEEQIETEFTISVNPSLLMLPSEFDEERAAQIEAQGKIKAAIKVRTLAEQMVVSRLRQVMNEENSPMDEVAEKVREKIGKMAADILASLRKNEYLAGPSAVKLRNMLATFRRIDTGRDALSAMMTMLEDTVKDDVSITLEADLSRVVAYVAGILSNPLNNNLGVLRLCEVCVKTVTVMGNSFMVTEANKFVHIECVGKANKEIALATPVPAAPEKPKDEEPDRRPISF